MAGVLDMGLEHASATAARIVAPGRAVAIHAELALQYVAALGGRGEAGQLELYFAAGYAELP